VLRELGDGEGAEEGLELGEKDGENVWGGVGVMDGDLDYWKVVGTIVDIEVGFTVGLFDLIDGNAVISFDDCIVGIVLCLRVGDKVKVEGFLEDILLLVGFADGFFVGVVDDNTSLNFNNNKYTNNRLSIMYFSQIYRRMKILAHFYYYSPLPPKNVSNNKHFVHSVWVLLFIEFSKK
jgi:hypothetical protein